MICATAPSPLRRATHSRQRGAATLIVVMVLFFLMSMVAAYTSRNLIFEQRTSANQYRSTQALEAAEAGLQWAQGLLNSGRIDADCRPSTNLADTSFRQRYLNIDAGTGGITPIPKGPPLPPLAVDPTVATLEPSCVFNGATWNCSCPSSGEVLAPTAPSGSAVYPAYRVRFRQWAARPNLVRVEVNACTNYDDNCLNFPPSGVASEGRASIWALLTLKGAVSAPLAAALTLRGSLDLAGAPLSVYNTSPSGSGITVQAGGAVTRAGLVIETIRGSPSDPSVIDSDAPLTFPGYAAADRPDAMFSTTFGMRRSVYRDQPGAVMLACAGTCSAADLRTAIAQNPGRVIWAEGNVDFDSTGDIGSATEPVAVVATGNVLFSAPPPLTIYGLVYTQAPTWASSGTATLFGAMVAEGDVGGSSTASLAYDQAILDNLRYRTGSFVMVPGSWRDFP